MSHIRRIYIIFIITAGMLLASCSNTRKLPAGDALYIGSTVKVDGPDLSRKKKKAISGDMSAMTRPRPNKKFLGMRFKLWVYNLAGNPKKRNSPAGWLKYTVGEPPVLLSDVNLDYNKKVLHSTLENRGYFQVVVEGDSSVKNRKARAIYTIQTGPQYMINEVKFEGDSTQLLQQEILKIAPETLLKQDKPFDLDVIKGERSRIDNYLKEHGFYYFSPEFLVIQTDSTIGGHKVNLYVKLKLNTPAKAMQVYRINDVYIMPNYRLNNSTNIDTSKQNATYYKGYYVIDRRKTYNPRMFEQAMQFKPGDVYNRTDHNLTINRLVTLGVFKFVKNRFAEVPGTDSNLLNTYYYLTPSPKKSIRGEINGNTKSNNLTGSSVTIGWRNKNTFKGGELLTIDATGGFEVQYSGTFRGYNTFRGGIETSLSFPRFITPFVYVNTPGGFVPKTRFTIAYDFLTKQKLYTMNSFRLNAGYLWRESFKKEHQFNPVSITYVQPLLITQEYEDSIRENPIFAKAVEKQFILGSSYNYNYNGLTEPFNTGFYFNGLIDLSGNVVGLLSGASQSKPKFIMNAQFAQYLKFETDLRYYLNITPGSVVLANRLIVGTGFPYGNSKELPYIKQFFIGGNNSIRAFRSRTIGPGTYLPDPTANLLPDQSGDMKLEINTELRARLTGILHGALFVDAGNIWLFNENPLKPGGKFSKTFLNELAVGAGVGLRFDISFLVLRLDVAFPLRDPGIKRWLINDIDPLSPTWRRENLVYNLGIGYPF